MEKLLKTTPIKKPMMLLTTTSLLFALRVVLGLFSISLGPTVLSFTWVSLFIAGFMLGPILGFGFGVMTDTFGFFTGSNTKIWMWQYAMQEPLICLLGGLMYLLYKWIKENEDLLWFNILYQVVILGATIFSTTMILVYFNEGAGRDGGEVKYVDAFGVKVAGIVLMFITYIILALIPLYRTYKGKETKLFMITVLLVYIPWTLFSWAFGAYFYSLFWKILYPDGTLREDWFVFYSLSRILKSMFVIPIEIGATYALLKALTEYSKRSEYINFVK